ncbi:MAG: hypothetical protein HFH67_17825 [Lachnospiraceae bacterium]|nr:hypothetical protein [Lachnospiraceae bacterium]
MRKINVLETSKTKFVKNYFLVLTGGIAGSTCFWFIAVIFYNGVKTGFQIPLLDSFLNGGFICLPDGMRGYRVLPLRLLSGFCLV